ncbi:helix-turn-helix transcriptional regulator [Acinetobacter sp.]|uniref:helix-turn-helix transcriptional regulator n=1 Tax=Acinetobacter sp. TaxID=472 RepID=UPI003D03E1A7
MISVSSVSPETLPVRIRDRRVALGLSQSQLALKAGVDRTYLNKVERGKHTPSITFLKTLSFELGCNLEDLLKDTNISVGADTKSLSVLWDTFGRAIADATNLPLFITNSSGFVMSYNSSFLTETGFRSEEIPFVNITTWLPTSAIPSTGKINARVQGRNGRRFNASISFYDMSASLPDYHDMIICTMIPDSVSVAR